VTVHGTPENRANQHCRGFTLLELLVTLTLLSMLALMLMGGLRLGGRVWERTTAEDQRTEDVRIAADFLRASVAEAYPLLDRSDATHPKLSFGGEPKALHYLAPMPLVLDAAGMARIDLHLERGTAGTGRLFIDLRRELAIADAAPLSSTLLLDQVQDLDIAYFGAAERGKAPEWQDHWESAVALPELVRVRIAFPPGDKRIWPDLLIAPRIAVEATCAYDPLTLDCRGR
jgi:general secretion pathway protein J